MYSQLAANGAHCIRLGKCVAQYYQRHINILHIGTIQILQRRMKVEECNSALPTHALNILEDLPPRPKDCILS